MGRSLLSNVKELARCFDQLHIVCVNPWGSTRPQWRVVIDNFDIAGDSYTAISLTNHDTQDRFTVSNVTESYDHPGRTAGAPAVAEMLTTIHTTLTSSFDVPL